MKAATRKSPIAAVSHSQYVNSLIPRGGEGKGEREGEGSGYETSMCAYPWMRKQRKCMYGELT